MSELDLKRFAPLAELDAPERQAVAEELESLELAAGVLLFEEGDASEAMYLLCEGFVFVESRTCWGGGQLGPGSVLAALALVGDTRRRARVETASRCRLLRLERAGLLRVAVADPGAAEKLRRGIWREASALAARAVAAGVDPSGIAD